MRDFVTYDNSRLPIVVCTVGDFEPTSEELVAYQKKETELIKKPEIVQIYDVTNLRFLPSELRISQTKWLSENKDLLKENVYGIAYYTPKFMARVILKAIFILNKPASPYVVVKTKEEAYEFAKKMVISPRAKDLQISLAKY